MAADTRAMHRAPYFLWTNVRDLPASQEPLTSPIYFAPLLFNSLGLELPPYYALLTELHQHITAMEQGEYFAPTGETLDPASDPETERLLEDYRLVQYDFSVGQRYSLDRMFPQ